VEEIPREKPPKDRGPEVDFVEAPEEIVEEFNPEAPPEPIDEESPGETPEPEIAEVSEGDDIPDVILDEEPEDLPELSMTDQEEPLFGSEAAWQEESAEEPEIWMEETGEPFFSEEEMEEFTIPESSEEEAQPDEEPAPQGEVLSLQIKVDLDVSESEKPALQAEVDRDVSEAEAPANILDEAPRLEAEKAGEGLTQNSIEILGILYYLRGLIHFLPEHQRVEFSLSDARLEMEYLIDYLEGRKGLYRGIRERVPERALIWDAGNDAPEDGFSAPTPGEVARALAYLEQLAAALPDPDLGTAITRKVDIIIKDIRQLID
jgi:hypothetical protein